MATLFYFFFLNLGFIRICKKYLLFEKPKYFRYYQLFYGAEIVSIEWPQQKSDLKKKSDIILQLLSSDQHLFSWFHPNKRAKYVYRHVFPVNSYLHLAAEKILSSEDPTVYEKSWY